MVVKKASKRECLNLKGEKEVLLQRGRASQEGAPGGRRSQGWRWHRVFRELHRVQSHRNPSGRAGDAAGEEGRGDK